ncbi:MAG: hypothetical protein J3R72DRAFT_31479 [Linnemannia gamsii]|nr:MAG: hypothetical protein J3R72DRAFT_31479 [Linnemannia gamsii]
MHFSMSVALATLAIGVALVDASTCGTPTPVCCLFYVDTTSAAFQTALGANSFVADTGKLGTGCYLPNKDGSCKILGKKGKCTSFSSNLLLAAGCEEESASSALPGSPMP